MVAAVYWPAPTLELRSSAPCVTKTGNFKAVLTVAEFAWAVKHDRIGNYSPRGKPNRNRFGRSLPRRTSPWLTLRCGPSVTGLPITLLKRADELCIGQYVALHCSFYLRFRRVS